MSQSPSFYEDYKSFPFVNKNKTLNRKSKTISLVSSFSSYKRMKIKIDSHKYLFKSNSDAEVPKKVSFNPTAVAVLSILKSNQIWAYRFWTC